MFYYHYVLFINYAILSKLIIKFANNDSKVLKLSTKMSISESYDITSLPENRLMKKKIMSDEKAFKLSQ